MLRCINALCPLGGCSEITQVTETAGNRDKSTLLLVNVFKIAG